MNKLNQHLTREITQWKNIQATESHNIKLSQQHLIYNLIAYLTISIIEYWLASISKSQALRADAFNNLSGIVSTCLLMIGLHIARNVDNDMDNTESVKNNFSTNQRIQFVHWRYETIFSLITGATMVAIAINVIYNGIKELILPSRQTVPQLAALIGAGIASIIMLVVWLMNRKAGQRLNSAALLASAQDSLSDAFTSIGTLLSLTGAMLFHIKWLDAATGIIVGLFILYSGLSIFRESSLNLADYFSPQAEQKYKNTILQLPQVDSIPKLKAHYNGNLVTLNVAIVIDSNMNVSDSFELAETIETLMKNKFGIIDTDVSFIPKPTPDINKADLTD